jgi:hypothetical protein
LIGVRGQGSEVSIKTRQVFKIHVKVIYNF